MAVEGSRPAPFPFLDQHGDPARLQLAGDPVRLRAVFERLGLRSAELTRNFRQAEQSAAALHGVFERSDVAAAGMRRLRAATIGRRVAFRAFEGRRDG